MSGGEQAAMGQSGFMKPVVISAMTQAPGDCSRGRADVHVRRDPFEFVMPGFVEQVIDADQAAGFEREVTCQSGSAAAEHARDGIQFLAAIREVGAGHAEVGNGQSARDGKQDSVLTVPETMLANWLRRDHHSDHGCKGKS